MFFQHIANKEKNNIDYKTLSSKVDVINLFDRYNTLYNYFSKISVEKTSIKNKSFFKNLLKGFKFKCVYTKGKNNVKKAYDDLVLSNKKIDDVFYKRTKGKLSDRNEDIFQEAKNLLHLRVEIYKKLVLEEGNLKF